MGRLHRARHSRKLALGQLTEEGFPKNAALRQFLEVAQELRRLLIAE